MSFVDSHNGTAGLSGAPAPGTAGSYPIDVSDVVGVAETADGGGYWVVTSTGTVYPFGDAKVFPAGAEGSASSKVVGIVATPDDQGYFLVNAEGAVFPYGNAHFYGDLLASKVSTSDVVGMATTGNGEGYFLLTAKGAVYNFEAATNHASVGKKTHLLTPVVSITADDATGGYWLVGS